MLIIFNFNLIYFKIKFVSSLHYCAEILKEIPLFESRKTQNCSVLLNENSEPNESQAPCVVSQVDDEDIGRFFLAADNMS